MAEEPSDRTRPLAFIDPESSVDVTSSPATGRRLEVLDELRASPRPLSIAELAARLDVHPNTVRFHLDALTATGQVERVDQVPTGRGRPPLVFRVPAGMNPAGPRSYRLLASILADTLADLPDGPARAAAAGRRWGEQLAAARGDGIGSDREALDLLLEVLTDLGFAPEHRAGAENREPREPETSGGEIGLRHCPFLELTRGDTRLICPVHLGLMQGVLAASGSSIGVEALVPFVQPDLCVARLSRVDPRPPASER